MNHSALLTEGDSDHVLQTVLRFIEPNVSVSLWFGAKIETKGAVGSAVLKHLFFRLNLGLAGQVVDCSLNASYPACSSRKSELPMEVVEIFLNVLELWSTIKMGV